MNERDERHWVVRTDFSNDEQWNAVCDLIARSQTDVGAVPFEFVECVSDLSRRGLPVPEVVRSLPDDYPGLSCFVVDRETIQNPEHPILVVGFEPSDNESFGRPPRNTRSNDIATFRAVPAEVFAIYANLSLANLDFEDFANAVDDDGIYRGFPRKK